MFGVASGANVVQLDPFADNSIRVRVAPPGGAISSPPLQALLASAPAFHAVRHDSAFALTNGNLRVTLDPVTSFLTAVRISDGAILLQQTALQFSAPAVLKARVPLLEGIPTNPLFTTLYRYPVPRLALSRHWCPSRAPLVRRYMDWESTALVLLTRCHISNILLRAKTTVKAAGLMSPFLSMHPLSDMASSGTLQPQALSTSLRVQLPGVLMRRWVLISGLPRRGTYTILLACSSRTPSCLYAPVNLFSSTT